MTLAILTPVAPADAIAALERRGQRLERSFSWQDAWEAEHARMFTVAKSAGFDILTEIRDALSAAIAEGRTFRDFAKDLRPVLEAKGWWGRKEVADPLTGETREAQLGSTRRLRTIFDVNMRVSYAEGHWARFERGKKARPFLRYVAILDGRVRPAHRARHNLCLPVDDPYWNRWAPPCGWGCRCTLQSLSQRDVDRMRDELQFDPPPDTFRTFTNARTGEVSRVPDGIDPGWAYNPGKVGWQPPRISAKAPEPLRDAAASAIAPTLPVAFGPGVSDEFRAAVTEAWSLVPDPVKARLVKVGITVHAPRRVVDVLPELAGVQPRGWPPGSTFEQVEGVRAGMRVIVAETIYDGFRGTWRSGGRARAILLHEVGHGLDGALSQHSAAPGSDFASAYREDVAAYTAAGGDLGDERYAYFLQPGRAGASEMFAELFADVLGFPSNPRSPPLQEQFPRAAAYMRELLRRV